MRFPSLLLGAVLLAAIARPALAIQLPPQGNSLMTYNFKGNIKFHGPFKAAPHTLNVSALTTFRKAGDACNTLMFEVKMSDGSMHSTHATGNAANGLCTYSLTFTGPVGLKISAATFSSCGGTFADITVDPVLIGLLANGNAELNFTEPGP
jgi:hypothetical protein